MVFVNGTFEVQLNGLSHPRTGQASEPPHGWFYCLPRFREAFTTASGLILKEKLPASLHGTYQGASLSNEWSGSAQKKFLVFDQSGDQTTLMFSTGIATRAPSLWSSKPPGVFDFIGEVPRTSGDLNHHSGPNLIDEFDENNETDDLSEMHEDTEELNALLYSDDESDYTQGDEVTSTGHSPSAMTAQYKPNWFKGNIEEVVASCTGPRKKRKLFDDGCDDMPALMDTASSVNQNISFDKEDAESACANGWIADLGPIGSVSRNKRMRKERIVETVSILQNIIPDVKGKAAIVVIDEAINYLKSLKLKAQALGLGAI